MRYLSICSGIEAASVAWHTLGWTPAGFAEIDRFPSAVLKHHFPHVPNHGDFTEITADAVGPVDLLVGGTPCQSFSVAGLRAGLDDERGNLALEFCRLARRTCPRWVVWENVPGVLSLDGGRAFAAILGGLAECGYGLAYRVMDAQFVRVDLFGRAVPQRRRRVFVVGHRGSWQRAAAVLFERASLRWDTPPRRQAGERVARPLAARAPGGSGYRNDADTAANLVAQSLTASSGGLSGKDGIDGRIIAFCGNDTTGPIDVATARNAHGGHGQVTHPLDTDGFSIGIFHGWRVRRLTPVECERLQGFPDGYTAIPYRGKPAADGPRYKALGNSMAVNCMRWIGMRIAMVDAIPAEFAA